MCLRQRRPLASRVLMSAVEDASQPTEYSRKVSFPASGGM